MGMKGNFELLRRCDINRKRELNFPAALVTPTYENADCILQHFSSFRILHKMC